MLASLQKYQLTVWLGKRRWAAGVTLIAALACRRAADPTIVEPQGVHSQAAVVPVPASSLPMATTVLPAAESARSLEAPSPVAMLSSVDAGPADASAASASVTPKPTLQECLSKYYSAKPTASGMETALGVAVPMVSKDPSGKEFGLVDLFKPPYPLGPVVEIRERNMDPGRVRIQALFLATYGSEPLEVEAKLRWVTFVGQRIRIQHRAAPALERVSKALELLCKDKPALRDYLRNLGGTYNFRNIAGTDQLSAHSFGIAIDISTHHSDYWRNGPDLKKPIWKNRIPTEIVNAFEAESFIWGGRWYHYDTMHFEYRPELFDPECRPDGKGIQAPASSATNQAHE
jgi:D-alanyl-D-alanine carboxypeptidase